MKACSVKESIINHNDLKRMVIYSDDISVSYVYGNDSFEADFNAQYYFLHGKSDCTAFRQYLKKYEIN